MASTVSLLKDFANGQGAGFSNYFTYAPDLDDNFQALESTVNQLVQEVKSLQGPNAAVAIDVLQINDPAGPDGFQGDGVIGEHSYRVEIGSPTSQLIVRQGQIVVGGERNELSADATLVGSGGAGTRWVAVDSNGSVSLESSAGVEILDVASAEWDGAAFTSVTQLAHIFMDGDAWAAMLARAETGDAGSPTFPEEDFRTPAQRLEEIERLLAGIKTAVGPGGAALGPIAFGGSAAAPGLVPTDGAGTYETDSGFYRVAVDVVGYAAAGTKVLELRSAGIRANADGSAGAPWWSWVGDPDTGLFRVGPNRLGFATAGVQVGEFDAAGNLDLPTNSRVKGVRSVAQTIAHATPTLVSFTAADAFDVGSWHAPGAGAPGDQEFTVPADGDGLYFLLADFEWAAPAANPHDLLVEITVNGSADAENWERTLVDASHAKLTIVRELAAADVVRMQVTATDTGGTASVDLERASLAIVKIA